jgi:hypothetical protein
MQATKLTVTSLSNNEERRAERELELEAAAAMALRNSIRVINQNFEMISGSYPSHSLKIDIRVVRPSRAT